MERLHNGYTLTLCEGAFPLSTDSIALAGFAKLPKQAKVLDLGAGCGTLGLLLCAQNADCTVTGVEIDRCAHETALHNAAANDIGSRLFSICADIRDIPGILPAGGFHVCISNPPYFSAGPRSSSVPLARRDDLCSMESLLKAAAWSLRYGGDCFLVHRPERLAELFSCAARHQLEPKVLRILRHKEDGPVSLVLVRCRKGAKPGLKWEEVSLHDRDGALTPYYRELYHL